MNLPLEQEAIRAKCFHPSGTFVEFPIEDVETSIPARFEKIARQYPDRIAVKMGGRSFTYDHLNRAANRVARAILEKCGDKVSPILVLADHHPEGIISCLGVLKAGKLLVAVDPSWPIDRLTFMAEDSKAAAILIYGDNLIHAKNLETRVRPIINIDALSGDISSDNIGVTPSPLDPANIRYTSGSTGTPKGVIRSHCRNLFTYRLSINRGRICPDDRMIILRPLGFSITDTFTGLMAGATAVPFDIKGQGLPGLGKFLHTEEITYFIATPSIFRYFAQELNDGEEFPRLRMVKLGGEPCLKIDIELYKKHFSSNCLLLNQLAGNEMGPICEYWITKETEIDMPVVPVGYPVEGKQVFLVDEELQEVGANQTGEIAVSSRYLSSGYWNNSEGTKEKFLPGNDSLEAPLYLSGDVGRKLSDGCLIYLGRKDDQIKIRGAKVEVGEILAVISEHPQIKNAAVLAFDRGTGDKFLTAYVVPRHHPAPTVTDITGYLRKRLPDYMIPSVFMFLESLPLNNGKLDRKNLPMPDSGRPELRTPYAAPKSKIEERLVQVWQEVLQIHPIGVEDDFFDLGGHSLNASRVISRVIQSFQLDVPIKALFEAPTVAKMATVISEGLIQQATDADLARLLSEVDPMTEADAQRLVSEIDSTITKK